VFAPRAAEPQTKAGIRSTSQAAHGHEEAAAHRRDHDPLDALPLFQRTSANHAAWDFGRIPLLSSDRPKALPVSSAAAVPRRSGVIQPKLAIGAVDDPLEREADRIAAQVVRMPPAGVGQPTASAPLARSHAAPQAIAPAPSTLPSVIRRQQWSDAPAGGAKSVETTPPPQGWNKAETTVAGVRRIPLEGIPGGNTLKDKQPAAAEAADNRAIALVPAGLDPSQPVDVLLHLHGWNVGYRQRKTKGSDDETLRVGSVRDVESDRIEQQIAASKRPIIAVLPQGTALSGFGKLNSDAYIAEVFKKLTAMGAWGPQKPAPPIGRVILSAHSGGGGRTSEMMAEPGTPRLPSALKEVALFDAINGPGELGIVTTWVQQHLDNDLATLMSLGTSTAGAPTSAQTAYLQKSMRVRAYYSQDLYRKRHETLQKSIDDWFAKNAAPALGTSSPLYAQLRDNYRTIPVHHGEHNKIMGKDNRLLDALTTMPAQPAATQSVQPKADSDYQPGAAPASVMQTLQAPGAALDAASRSFMEARFGYDFSGVRIHADADAALSASAIHARAYALGHHLVFAPGAYQPQTEPGARLLAHELTHVVQQAGAPHSGTLQRQAATQETAAPIRADEAGQTLPIFNFGQFSIFVPEKVALGARKEITNPKVHIFFAAGGVQGADTNDIFVHGLRGASNQSDWITIGVRGIGGSANTISDAQIMQCLQSVGINSAPVSVRLTGHSRGCDSVVATVVGGLIHTPIDRITLLDEAVEHVSTAAVLPGGAPDPARGAVRINRVQQLVQKGISPGIIVSYESLHKSANLLTGQSAKVAGATYHDLNPECMAAIGAARLVQDGIALRPDAARDAARIPAIGAQLRDLNLPPRGTFTTGPSTGGKVNINDFCFEPAGPGQPAGAAPRMKESIRAIRRNPVLVQFINSHNLARYSTVTDWTPFLAHEFFVAEIAHELTE
jgi:hypothetical protein